MKLALALSAVLVASVAWADEPHPPVALDLDPGIAECLGGDLDAVRKIVVLELGASLVQLDTPGATTVHVTCEKDSATITVDDPITRKLTQRAVQLGGQPVSARPRLLGLAIVETVASSWVELEMKPTPARATTAGPSVPNDVRSGAAAVARTRLVSRPSTDRSVALLSVAGTGRAFLGGTLVTTGGRLGAEWPVARRLGVGLDVAVEFGSVAVAEGDIGVALFSTTPRLDVRLLMRPVVLTFGIGFRVGLAEITGESRSADIDSRSFVAPWGGPTASFEGRASLSNPLGISVGLEAGIATISVHGQIDGVDAAKVDGGWGAAWLALTYAP